LQGTVLDPRLRKDDNASHSIYYFIMPELPEVETTVKGIEKFVKGKKILDVWTSYNSPFHVGKENIKNPKYFSKFKKKIIGTKITGASRRAKNVLIHLSNGETILIHMKMTGHILYGKYELNNNLWAPLVEGPLMDPFNQFLRFVLIFSNHTQLVLSDMRKFAKVHLINTNEIEKVFEKTGPEPLDKKFDIDKFKERLCLRKTGRIKNVLMDPKIIAGIGNIYSDEILWRVGLHPEEKVQNIPSKYFPLMFKAMQEVLNKGIDFGGDSMSDYRNIKGEKGKFQEHHQAYRRTGKSCTKKDCKGTIIRKKVGGRSAHFCDTHQKPLQ
jgi:formamidopyrimidine-DNA glycosylase